MSYATKKGYDGEKEVERLLTEALAPYGFVFMRMGGVERDKKIAGGDVVLNVIESAANGRLAGECVLAPYYIEVKKKAALSVPSVLEKAEKDAARWQKKAPLVFFILQPKGKKGKRSVILSFETFKELIAYAQRGRDSESGAGARTA